MADRRSSRRFQSQRMHEQHPASRNRYSESPHSHRGASRANSSGGARFFDQDLFNGRLGWILAIFLAVAVILALRLVWLQVVDAQNNLDRGTSRDQVRSTTPLSSTEHSCSTLTARLPFLRSQSLCARATAVRTSLWAASSCVQTSTSHGRLQRLRLWVQAVPLQSSAARKLRLRRRLAKTLRHSSQRRKTSTQRSSPTRTRQLLTATSTT